MQQTAQNFIGSENVGSGIMYLQDLMHSGCQGLGTVSFLFSPVKWEGWTRLDDLYDSLILWLKQIHIFQ